MVLQAGGKTGIMLGMPRGFMLGRFLVTPEVLVRIQCWFEFLSNLFVAPEGGMLSVLTIEACHLHEKISHTT